MSHIPYLGGFDIPAVYGHDTFPNRMYHRQHPRFADPFDLSALNVIASLGNRAHHRGDELAPITTKKDLFEAHIDVGRFKPEEISVKVVNHCVVVEGRHEERADDHGYISRHFLRRYELPKDYDPEKIVSVLNDDGILTVRAPRPVKPNESGEFIVPIQYAGASKLILQNGQKNNEETEKKAVEEKK